MESGTFTTSAAVHWARSGRNDDVEADGRNHRQVLVWLKPAGDAFAETVTRLQEVIASSDGMVAISEAEAISLSLIAEIERESEAPIEEDEAYAILLIHEEFEIDQLSDLIEPREYGERVEVEATAAITSLDITDRSVPKDADRKVVPIMGIVDDGIGYLNSAFQAHKDGPRQTRFLSVWLQGRRIRKDAATIAFGKVINASEINDQIVLDDEANIYQAQNRRLYRLTEEKAVEQAVSHGTFVADIACGRDPASVGDADLVPKTLDARAEPIERILAVQPPPLSFRDSSSRRLGLDVLAGIRWMIARVLLHPERDIYAPLVVNLSLGQLAGPKDGSGAIESTLRAEARRFERWSHVLFGKSFPMRTVLAYGNSYRSSQVAHQKEVPHGEVVRLDWRLVPDDKTRNLLEIRVEAGADVEILITPPNEAEQAVRPPVGHWIDLQVGGVLGIARVYRELDENGRELFVVAVRETCDVKNEGGPLAEPGLWKVGVKANSAKTEATWQVERDDTPIGYRVHGRQSYLDHPLSHGFDLETGTLDLPEAPPITREGTHSAYISAPAKMAGPETLVSIGGVMRWSHKPVGDLMARYSASGSHEPFLTTSTGPTASAFSEDGFMHPGVIAAGTLSGSTGRIGGTSAAAPQASRRLLALLATTPQIPTAEDEESALIGPEAANADLRRGAGVIQPTRIRDPETARPSA